MKLFDDDEISSCRQDHVLVTQTNQLQTAAEHAIKELVSNISLPKLAMESDASVHRQTEYETLKTYLDQHYVRLDGFVGFVAVSPDRQTLFDCNELADGTPELSDIFPGHLNWGEVTAPENQEFLDAVNRVFSTAFRYENFAGR